MKKILKELAQYAAVMPIAIPLGTLAAQPYGYYATLNNLEKIAQKYSPEDARELALMLAAPREDVIGRFAGYGATHAAKTYLNQK